MLTAKKDMAGLSAASGGEGNTRERRRMFTGLVQNIGIVAATRPRGEGLEIAVRVPEIAGGLSIGESVAVDGCCLTVETRDRESFTAFASAETLRKTTLGERRVGARLNLERALALGDRMGGHMVSGHVDATGRVRSVVERGDAREVRIEAPEAITGASIPKGSVAVDGISLTIVDLDRESFSLWIIPETWTKTTLRDRRPGDAVNLESDMIGKYVRKYLEGAGVLPGAVDPLGDVARRFAEARKQP